MVWIRGGVAEEASIEKAPVWEAATSLVSHIYQQSLEKDRTKKNKRMRVDGRLEVTESIHARVLR